MRFCAPIHTIPTTATKATPSDDEGCQPPGIGLRDVAAITFIPLASRGEIDGRMRIVRIEEQAASQTVS